MSVLVGWLAVVLVEVVPGAIDFYDSLQRPNRLGYRATGIWEFDPNELGSPE